MLEESRKLVSLRDWVGTVSSCQLAVENFAEAIIAVFEVPTWSHDPSDQLSNLIDRLPKISFKEIRELIAMVTELAPEHGRSTYGEPSAGLLPSDIYKEEHASSALEKAKRAREIAETILSQLNVSFK
ncbi:MAG: HEPN domain-containing protein [Thermoproteota archaeon]